MQLENLDVCLEEKIPYCGGVALPLLLAGYCGWLLVAVDGCSLPVVAMQHAYLYL